MLTIEGDELLLVLQTLLLLLEQLPQMSDLPTALREGDVAGDAVAVAVHAMADVLVIWHYFIAVKECVYRAVQRIGYRLQRLGRRVCALSQRIYEGGLI